MAVGQTLDGKEMLLIIGGGISAYKSLDLVRRLRERGATVRAVMTAAAREFVTPLSVSALTASRVFDDLFDRQAEHDVGHIRLARQADAIIVAPATADLLARMAHGLAGDLAGAILLATDAPVLAAPAMNPKMWAHPATRRNLATLEADGVRFVGPEVGEMAETGEAGRGRMAEPVDIADAVERLLVPAARPLAGRTAIVTSGPTHEAIDPVRYIANRSSGRQGHAIAAALRAAGAEVTLVSGPVEIADPPGLRTIHVTSAAEMHAAVEKLLPADIAVMVAAVADFRPADQSPGKIKKKNGKGPAALALTENPDILRHVAGHSARPSLVIGFAAETDDLVENAKRKFAAKGADLLVANDVSPDGGVMGKSETSVWLVTSGGVEKWPPMGKEEVARRLAAWIAARLEITEA